MQKWVKILLCAMLSFSFVFACIGYAALSDSLSVIGSAKVNIPSGLFIIKVETQTESYVGTNKVDFPPYSTTLDTIISRSSRTAAGKATYKVTVLNNTDLEYAWRDVYYQEKVDKYHNERVKSGAVKIEVSLDESDTPVIVPPGGQVEFTVTYTLNSSNKRNEEVKNLINFRFGINVDSKEKAIDIVHQKFLEILNTESTYKELFEKIDDKYDGYNEWTSNYIGNVGNASAADAVTVNTLFAGQLQMFINGVKTPATVLIKHENLDWDNMTGDDYVARADKGSPFYGYGCEMTLYLTIDPLKQAYSNAPVYVTVFTCDRNAQGDIISDWYRVGETMLGNAPIVGYNGEEGKTGSFVTDNWEASSQTYRLTDQYSYSLSAGMTLKGLNGTTGIMTFVDQGAINEFQRLIIDAKAMIEDNRYAGMGILDVENAYERAAKYYTLDAEGNPVANAGVERVKLCPIIAELDRALTVAQDAIDKLPEH